MICAVTRYFNGLRCQNRAFEGTEQL